MLIGCDGILFKVPLSRGLAWYAEIHMPLFVGVLVVLLVCLDSWLSGQVGNWSDQLCFGVFVYQGACLVLRVRQGFEF